MDAMLAAALTCGILGFILMWIADGLVTPSDQIRWIYHQRVPRHYLGVAIPAVIFYGAAVVLGLIWLWRLV